MHMTPPYQSAKNMHKSSLSVIFIHFIHSQFLKHEQKLQEGMHKTRCFCNTAPGPAILKEMLFSMVNMITFLQSCVFALSTERVLLGFSIICCLCQTILLEALGTLVLFSFLSLKPKGSKYTCNAGWRCMHL